MTAPAADASAADAAAADAPPSNAAVVLELAESHALEAQVLRLRGSLRAVAMQSAVKLALLLGATSADDHSVAIR